MKKPTKAGEPVGHSLEIHKMNELTVNATEQNHKPTMSSREIAELSQQGYLYACLYSGGTLKVGMTRKDPKDRIRCHDNTMRLAGEERDGHYISRKIAAPRQVESLVIGELSKRFAQLHREWFKGPQLEDVRLIVERESIDANHPSAVSAREKAEANFESRWDKAVDGINKAFGCDPEISPKNGYLFSRCMDFARCMEQVMLAGPLADHEHLDSLDRGKYQACSQFVLMAATTLFNSPREEWDKLFFSAANDPENLMIWVEGVCWFHANQAGLI